MSESKERCETCRFMRDHDEGHESPIEKHLLTCQRNPPQIVEKKSLYFSDSDPDEAHWPIVEPSYWCGEYKPEKKS